MSTAAESASDLGPPSKATPDARPRKKAEPDKKPRSPVQAAAHIFAVVVFGVIFPVIVLWQAYEGMSVLRSDIAGPRADVVRMFREFKQLAKDNTTADDYALFSVMYVEQSNKQAIINKQLLKVVIMQVGFSVISLGLMFIILGISDGGATVGARSGGFRFDLKTGSTGLVTFVIGAAMTAGGALVPNEYKTVSIPSYAPQGFVVTTAPYGEEEQSDDAAPPRAANQVAVKTDSTLDRNLADDFKTCNKLPKPEKTIDCFMDKFRVRYGGLL
ncbi:UNVERIFIED_ORG: hypothetical protein BDU10_2517 [Burkholderia sp. CF145]